ncbi:MAG TPA: hypothetical protein VE870_14740 [Bacteroidales bacterium]|nr:hypothetical protein [Bacteroidales bacterium]
MAKNKIQHYNFSSVDLLIYMWEKRWILITVSLLAAVVSVFMSFQITPKFRSSVVMFPTTNAPVSKSLLSPNYSGRQTVYGFGEEEQAEQLLQILNSEPVKERIIRKYDLMKHYDIDPASKYPYTRLYEEYNSNISFRMTQYMSVMIEVMDKDPQMAANIANDIAALIDTVYNNMLKERANEAYNLVEKSYQEAEQNVNSIQDSLEALGKLGINNYETQAERFNEAYANALKDGKMDGARRIQEKMKVLSKYGGTYLSLVNRLNFETERLADLRQRYKEAQVEMDQKLAHKFIVDSAYKAEKKAYPKKSIIVIISTLSAFLLTLILLIINDSIRERLERRKEE